MAEIQKILDYSPQYFNRFLDYLIKKLDYKVVRFYIDTISADLKISGIIRCNETKKEYSSFAEWHNDIKNTNYLINDINILKNIFLTKRKTIYELVENLSIEEIDKFTDQKFRTYNLYTYLHDTLKNKNLWDKKWSAEYKFNIIWKNNHYKIEINKITCMNSKLNTEDLLKEFEMCKLNDLYLINPKDNKQILIFEKLAEIKPINNIKEESNMPIEKFIFEHHNLEESWGDMMINNKQNNNLITTPTTKTRSWGDVVADRNKPPKKSKKMDINKDDIVLIKLPVKESSSIKVAEHTMKNTINVDESETNSKEVQNNYENEANSKEMQSNYENEAISKEVQNNFDNIDNKIMSLADNFDITTLKIYEDINQLKVHANQLSDTINNIGKSITEKNETIDSNMAYFNGKINELISKQNEMQQTINQHIEKHKVHDYNIQQFLNIINNYQSRIIALEQFISPLQQMMMNMPLQTPQPQIVNQVPISPPGFYVYPNTQMFPQIQYS